MFCVYLATNTVNGKYYVGKTRRSIKERWAKHVRDAKYGSDLYFHSALRKYGTDAFIVEQLVEAESDSQLLELEKLWIISLNACDSTVGYNTSFGGDGYSFTSMRKHKELRLNLDGSKIAVLYNQGYGTSYIAKQLRTNSPAVIRKLNRMGIKIRSNSEASFKRYGFTISNEELLKLRQSGMKIEQLMEKSGMSRTNVYRRLGKAVKI